MTPSDRNRFLAKRLESVFATFDIESIRLSLTTEDGPDGMPMEIAVWTLKMRDGTEEPIQVHS